MTAPPDALMLFAAGFGTRMGPLTQNKPKPLISVGGKALIDHALSLVDDFGDLDLVVNLHYRADRLAEHLSARRVQLSYELPDILDTGGGLKAALPLLNTSPVFTMNSDAIWSGPNPLRQLAEAWRGQDMDALLICLEPDNVVGREGPGDFSFDPEGRVLRGGGLVYGGVQIIKTGAVAEHAGTVFSLNEIWDKLAARGRLFGCRYPGRWCDVGHPGGLKLAEALLTEPHV